MSSAAATLSAASGLAEILDDDQRPRPAGRGNLAGQRIELVFAAGDEREIVPMGGEDTGEIGADPPDAPVTRVTLRLIPVAPSISETTGR